MIQGRVAFALLVLALAGAAPAAGEEHGAHPPPERLGTVSFPTSCAHAVQPGFERGLALLHSFAYASAEQAFREVAARDGRCAIAHWGIALTRFHQLWEPPPAGADLREGALQLRRARAIGAGSARERAFIAALGAYYRDADRDAPALRAERYAAAMARVAARFPKDPEAQIFYALALIATAPPSDASHGRQKQAVAILEPLWRAQPDHPGLAHYLIHATDSAELAPQGLAAARAYARIAPAVPHALHMPSHLFTRLGLWDDSIASNEAARAAAHAQGDVGEELHARDYLTYALLQRGRVAEAEQQLVELAAMPDLPAAQFKVGYAATAMPARVAIERRAWSRAAALEPVPQAAASVAALTWWARAVGEARGGHPREAGVEIERLRGCLNALTAAQDAYWRGQVEGLLREAEAWRDVADGAVEAALLGLRAAAAAEDALEKRPVTPGPIVPAREQLGELLLALQRPAEALGEFRAALALAPGRRGALEGALAAAGQLGDADAVRSFRAALGD